MKNILVLDKPKGLSSNKAIQVVKAIARFRKVGHAGTLDPNATGVLVIGVNKGTKLLGTLTGQDKEYIATIQFGLETDTYDPEGEVLNTKEVNFTKEQVLETVNSFLGKQKQTAPIYSAIKINGRKLYEYARAGETVELPIRDVDIKEIELISFEKDTAVVRVLSSKGTYIRSLAVDIAKKLDNYAILKDLRRTKSGEFLIEEAVTLDELRENTAEIKARFDI